MRLVAGLFALTLTTSLAFADQAKAPEPQAEQPRARAALRVVRILPDSHQALLFDKQRGTHVLVDLGDEVEGYQVQEIDDDSVTLAAEGKELVLAGPQPDRRRRGPAKAPKAAPAPAEIEATEPAATADQVVIAPVIIADEDGVQTVINAEAATAAAAAAAAPTRVGPWTAKKPAPAPALPAKDPYFVVEPPTTTPYDEIEGEVERPADPYTVPEGTATVTASANPYDVPAGIEDPYVVIEDEGATMATSAAPTTVIARRDLDAALADFGTLTRSLRGSFSARGAKLEQVAVGSVFAKAGLRAGDLVTAVDGRPVRSIDDAAELYVRAQTTRATNVQILRAGKPITLKVQIR